MKINKKKKFWDENKGISINSSFNGTSSDKYSFEEKILMVKSSGEDNI